VSSRIQLPSGQLDRLEPMGHRRQAGQAPRQHRGVVAERHGRADGARDVAGVHGLGQVHAAQLHTAGVQVLIDDGDVGDRAAQDLLAPCLALRSQPTQQIVVGVDDDRAPFR